MAGSERIDVVPVVRRLVLMMMLGGGALAVVVATLLDDRTAGIVRVVAVVRDEVQVREELDRE